MPDTKQIIIDGDLHRRLKTHVANLGIATMKEYVESVLEHAMVTNGEPPVLRQPDPEPLVVEALVDLVPDPPPPDPAPEEPEAPAPPTEGPRSTGGFGAGVSGQVKVVADGW